MEVTEGSDGKILLRMQYKREDELVYRHIKFQETVQHGGLPRGHKEATPVRRWRAHRRAGLSSATTSSGDVRWKGTGW